MEPFRIDFAMNRGHEMLLDREPGIGRNELYELELEMLQAGPIPGLLPTDWVDIDGKITFRYALSGYRMLLHRLQQEPIAMEQYYALLLGVADALLECRDYMLRPEGCLLGERFIYVGERLSDLRLAYLPLRNDRGTANGEHGDLLSLVVKWTAYVDTIDGAGLKAILQLFNGNKWPLTELRDLLLRQIGQGSGLLRPPEAERTEGQPPGLAYEGKVPSLRSSHESAAQRLSSMPLQQAAFKEAADRGDDEQGRRRDSLRPGSLFHAGEPELSVSSTSGPFGQDEEEMLPIADNAGREKAKRGKWLVLAVGLVCAACVWRFVYLASPSLRSLLVSMGLTLILLAAGTFLWKREDAASMEETDGEEQLEPFGPDTGRLPIRHRGYHASDDDEATTSSIGDYSVAAKPQGRMAAIAKLADDAAARSSTASAAGQSQQLSPNLNAGLSPPEPSAFTRPPISPSSSSGQSSAALRASLLNQSPVSPGASLLNQSSASSQSPVSLQSSASAQSASLPRSSSFVQTPSMGGTARAVPPTVRLDKEQRESNAEGQTFAANGKMLLHRVWGGQEEIIELTANCFKIGRAVDGGGYTEHAEGVSRLHLEIERVDGMHQVKDLGSRNGSLLNGELMIPYKTYTLVEGDELRLGGEKGPCYVLKIGQ